MASDVAQFIARIEHSEKAFQRGSSRSKVRVIRNFYEPSLRGQEARDSAAGPFNYARCLRPGHVMAARLAVLQAGCGDLRRLSRAIAGRARVTSRNEAQATQARANQSPWVR